jgi:formiminotetrahydrofolate cyclodeaminase
MPDRFIERSLRAFSDDLSSDAPVPGGGSAAAYTGAMGAALAAMVGRISMKKEKSEALEAYVEETDNLRSDFLRLVEDDSAAYARVAEAMKLPRKTDEEKKERQERMQAALLAASRASAASRARAR